MLLKKDDIIRTENNPAMIEYYKQHGYVEVEAEYIDMPAILGEEGAGVVIASRRGKKASELSPPADLADLANDLSKGEDE